MNEYKPDSWVIIKLPSNYGYKVLGGWSGGYLYGDSWRLNSGITRIEREGEYYMIHGYSSSVYCCHSSRYTLSITTASIADSLKKQGAEVMDDREDWTQLLAEGVLK
tara:strand:- start:87 stop:407 length:321 start_codon:yes stop_codon:yes gene_type:complete